MVKMALSAGKNLTQISIFELIYQPFELKIQSKLGLFRSKSSPKNLWKSSKQLLEIKNIDCWRWKWSQFGKMTTSEGQNLDFDGHRIFFGIYTMRKYEPFESKNNAHTILNQLPNNFEKRRNLTKKYTPPVHHHPPTLPSPPQIKATDRSGINSKK